MKYILLILLTVSLLFAQYSGDSKYGSYLPSGKWDKTMADDAYTVGHWVFDNTYATDKSDGDVRSDLANSHDLTESTNFDYLNQFTGTSPVYEGGSSLEFDGVDDYFYILAANATDFNPGTNDFSIEMWIEMGSDITTKQYIISKRTSGYGAGYFIYIENGRLYAAMLTDSVQPVVSISISANSDNYVAATYDRDGDLKLYLYNNNSQIINTINISGYATFDLSPNIDFGIGAITSTGGSALSRYYKNKLIEVRYSNVARTAEEIAAYYSQF